MRDGDLVCLAGLWESCTEPVETESPRLPGLDLDQAEPAKLHTLTLITTTPNLLAKRVHDRMLVIVHPDDYATWLAPTRRHRNQITAPPVRRRADAGTLRHPPNE